MAQTLLPGEILAMTGQAADRLLKLDKGDAALLYLHLLRRGDLSRLGWPEPRLTAALEGLNCRVFSPMESSLPPARRAPGLCRRGHHRRPGRRDLPLCRPGR